MLVFALMTRTSPCQLFRPIISSETTTTEQRNQVSIDESRRIDQRAATTISESRWRFAMQKETPSICRLTPLHAQWRAGIRQCRSPRRRTSTSAIKCAPSAGRETAPVNSPRLHTVSTIGEARERRLAGAAQRRQHEQRRRQPVQRGCRCSDVRGWLVVLLLSSLSSSSSLTPPPSPSPRAAR